jgi:hypothetical protein
MNHDELRKNLRPIALTMQSLLCFVFLFLAATLSISWQAKRIFIPFYAEKIQLNVIIKPECAAQIVSTSDYYDTSKNCLECKRSTDNIALKRCDFGTVGTVSADVARSLIKENGLAFSTAGYLVGDKAYLRHTPFPLLQIHIPIWLFGLIPIFAFAYKKPRYS